MKVTVKFNILITFALIGYAALISPILPDDATPLLVESLFAESLTAQIIVGLLSAILSIIASMYLIRAIWNRLFPHLCEWKEINLAESYAISILAAIFVVQ
jgi:hypothetical protein